MGSFIQSRKSFSLYLTSVRDKAKIGNHYAADFVHFPEKQDGTGDGIFPVFRWIESGLPGLQGIRSRLINHFVLVLDDYHVIEAQSIPDGLAFLIERLPDPMRMIMTTRADPPLPLARMRAPGIGQQEEAPP